MNHGTTVKDICLRFNLQALRIDERKLVQFGLIEGLIRRIHKVSLTHGIWILISSSLAIKLPSLNCVYAMSIGVSLCRCDVLVLRIFIAIKL